MRKQLIGRQQNGFSILEVVIGIFIFVVGMLALAALQGALTRSMADSKLRTTAVNLADQAIELQRGFTRLTSDPGGVIQAYNDIVTPGTDPTTTVNGVIYTIDMDVTDYYYQLSSDTFTTTSTGALSSDYKQVEVTVSWDAVQDFRADEGAVVTTNDIGTGSITLTASIPAVITSASARVADESTGGAAAPPVAYQPGLRPDIVSLSLTDFKFKESLKPEPDVIRADELVETRFDVITYSQVGNSAVFLRREEFSTVSCECTLNAADSTNPGRRPVVWAGDEYAGGQFVEKPYGVSANNQQSSVCDSCCRDHNDGGSSLEDNADEYYNVYGPFKADSEYTGGLAFARKSNHWHYLQDGVTEAGPGDTYLEACRLVRVNGFFRVTQDFRREDQYIFPADFLDEQAEIDDYSDYVTDAVMAYHMDVADGYPTRTPPLPCIGVQIPPCAAQPTMQGNSPPVAINAGELPSWTELPFGSTNAKTQQLRKRGIYIDYMSDDLRYVLDCLADGDTVASCKKGDVILDKTGSTNTLEILPFFDVQLTLLSRWNENPPNTPVDTTNEALADNNAHSRGVISSDKPGSSNVDARGHRGNLGFTDTPAIDPVYNANETFAVLNVQAGNGGGNQPPSDPIIAGSLTESVPGNPSIIVGPGQGGAQCGQTGASWTCSVPTGFDSEVTISGYGKKNADRYACSVSVLPLLPIPVKGIPIINGTGATTTFNLSSVDEGTSYTINIQSTPC